jgi:hypothetical protein
LIRYDRAAGAAGLILLIFGFITAATIADDRLHLVPIHLFAAAGCFALFIIGGGLTAVQNRGFSRNNAHHIVAVVYTVLFVSAVTLINYLVARHDPLYLDTTQQKVHTLAPQTLKVIDRLKEPLIVRAFIMSDQPKSGLRNLLEQMSQRSNLVRTAFIDPEREPEVVERLGIEQSPAIHIEFDSPGSSPGRAEETSDGESNVNTRQTKIVGEIDEQSIVNGILKLTRGGEKKVYYLVGHGEPDPKEVDEGGFLSVREAIEGENLRFVELDLTSTEIPDDANLVVVAGPKRSMIPLEREKLAKYLEAGGNALFLYESRGSDDIPEIVKPLGIEVKKDVVVDKVLTVFSGPSLGIQPVVTRYGDHGAVENFNQRTIFSSLSSVSDSKSSSGKVTHLAFTSDSSWAERNWELVFGEKQEAELEEGDLKGPVPIAAAYVGQSENDKTSRVIVIGDSDFATNVNIHQLYNRDFLLNCINWLVGETDAVTIRARSLKASYEVITDDQFALLFTLAGIVFPEIILLCGFSIWLLRRG